jgi:hypothetical protein
MTDLVNRGNMAIRSLVDRTKIAEIGGNDDFLNGYFEGQMATIEIWMEPDKAHRVLASDALLSLKARIKKRNQDARNDKRTGREVQD